MTIAHLLEPFDDNRMTGASTKLLCEEELEEARLAAFERGYSAGWEDALAAQAETRGQVEAALISNLQDCSFTYHEALRQMSLSLKPMFQSLVNAVLPRMIEQSFGLHIVEQLHALAEEQVAQPVEVAVSPGEAEALRPLLDREFPVPVRLVEDGNLVPGQASLRVGTAECDVNCPALLAAIEQAMDAYFYQATEGIQNE